MEHSVAASAPLTGAIVGRAFPGILADAFWRHRLLHAMATAALLLASAVGWHTGNMPDFGVLAEYAEYLFIAFWICGSALALGTLFHLALVQRETEPLHTFLKSLGRFFGDAERIANSLNGLGAGLAFISAIGVLKGAIAILSPFAWDKALAHADRILHFGRAPHEWLWFVVQSPLALKIINIAYNFWFVVLITAVFTVCITRKDTKLRHQFLMSFMTVWTLGGFFLAMGLSSAGPCFYERLGFGNDFHPLMQALAVADRVYPIWALSTQDMLWSGYTGATTGSVGISAFPSLHVVMAVLFALYATRRSRLAGLVMWLFAGVIMVGSVVLGWHYALDGYAGAFLMIAIWKVCGYLLTRFAPDRMAAEIESSTMQSPAVCRL
ncbi:MULTISPECIES: phosphatase PAP2 family protein [Mesorhizobium]|uniref:phosphatase PAP2 family protein n=1 Tax=Mesorhizobium TaxID=68287 RepID=UPI001F3F22B2|nr:MULTISPECIES: phosphatase PAP2 family protein [Mesorhizobium]MCF6124210.1 phosphatase PAP2 family protein [Mesorhizobium ciceri]MCQ8816829.1 phosphatase PAP2 family protein [Mesorhizobium sp. SEMIA396]